MKQPFQHRFPAAVLLAAGAAFGAACSADTPSEPLGDLVPTDPLLQVNGDVGIVLCKAWADYSAGPDADFQFLMQATSGTFEPWVSGPDMDGDYQYTLNPLTKGCDNIWSGPSDAELTITEVPREGYELVRVVLPDGTILDPEAGDPVTFAAGAGGTVYFKNFEAPDGDFEGCTPGYWKQPHHLGNWTGYAPTDLFADVFGVSYPGTLLDALNARGGGMHALARHAVAALLNQANPDVNYRWTLEQIVGVVQEAFSSGDYEFAKGLLEEWNEAGCDLGRAPLDGDLAADRGRG